MMGTYSCKHAPDFLDSSAAAKEGHHDTTAHDEYDGGGGVQMVANDGRYLGQPCLVHSRDNPDDQEKATGHLQEQRQA